MVAPQYAAVEPPAEAPENVLVLDVLDFESGVPDHLPERFPRVATIVADLGVHRSKKRLVGRYEEEQSASGREEVVQTAQRPAIVFDVLEHVEADHRIELILPQLPAIVLGIEVQARHRDRGIAEKPVAEDVNVGLLDVRGHDQVALAVEKPCHVADAGPHFEYSRPDV